MPSFAERIGRRFYQFFYRYNALRCGRHIVAACAAVLAVSITAFHAPTSLLTRGTPSILFLVVVLSSWYGGFGPGLTSVFVIVATSELFSISSSADYDWMRLTWLSALAIVISSVRTRREYTQSAASAASVTGIRALPNGNLSARVLESFRDTAIAALDGQGRVVYANQAATNLLSQHSPEVLGKTVSEAFADADGSKLWTQFRHIAGGYEPYHFEHFVDRTGRWYAFHCYPNREGLVFNFSDITENKKQEAMRPLPLWEQDNEFKRIFKRIDYTLVDHARCYVLHQFAKNVSKITGDLAEVGVYKGGTAKLLALTVEPRARKTLHLFDTFAGMPPADAALDCHHEGDLGDTSLESVRHHLRDCGNVRFYQGFFPDTAIPIENSRFCMVHIDADIYNSVKASCVFFYPRLEKGGIMIFDDYGFPSCPGARKAVDEFFADKPECPVYLPSGQCVVVRT